jgi:hypothetical protein
MSSTYTSKGVVGKGSLCMSSPTRSATSTTTNNSSSKSQPSRFSSEVVEQRSDEPSMDES